MASQVSFGSPFADPPLRPRLPAGTKIAILGAGNGGLALALQFATLGYHATIWAPQDHPGQIPYVKSRKNVLPYQIGREVQGTYPINATNDIGTAIEGAEFIFFASVANAQQSFIDILQGHDLSNTDLIVIAGQGYTVKFPQALNVRRIIETNNFPGAAKLDKKHLKDGVETPTVIVKSWKEQLKVSIFSPTLDKAIEMSPDLEQTLMALLPNDRLVAVPPLSMMMTNLWITHAISAVLNVGRIKDTPEAIAALNRPALVGENLARVQEINPTPDWWFFYGQGTTLAVCKVQAAADAELRNVGQSLGIDLTPLLDDCNEEYGTNHTHLIEFATHPDYHNQQGANPTSVRHRYFTEEIWAIRQLVAIARAANVPVPIAEAFMTIIDHLIETNAAEDLVPKFDRAFLTRFGANPPAQATLLATLLARTPGLAYASSAAIGLAFGVIIGILAAKRE